ncbi:hypothetical protein COLO4_28155 [Corchorus olitorius]|uniref:Uncharacterized protein n=1 Tax=Corchorus olitorius TaxID=93759 RepID=A0A1R3HMT4_9ROSI|nr:hypothetical protein COLO4_28155 [Corchorus olitorius]
MASKNDKGTTSKEAEDMEFYMDRNVNPCFVVEGWKDRDDELYLPTDVTKNYNLILEDEEEITFIDPLARKRLARF